MERNLERGEQDVCILGELRVSDAVHILDFR
jgi:hypothetical protein